MTYKSVSCWLRGVALTFHIVNEAAASHTHHAIAADDIMVKHAYVKRRKILHNFARQYNVLLRRTAGRIGVIVRKYDVLTRVVEDAFCKLAHIRRC